MIRMGTIWDRTAATWAARGAALAAIAALFLFLPALVQAAVATWVPRSGSASVTGLVVAVAVLVLSLWGQLAIAALTLDIAADRPGAVRAAASRLGAAIGVIAVLIVALLVLVAPIWIVLAASGFDMTAAMTAAQTPGATMPTMPAGASAFVVLYMLALTIVVLGLGARLIVVAPVILAERRGLGAIGRSLRLTRGLTWRIIGVLILYLVVIGVSALAAQAVVGIVLRLLLGPESRVATFLVVAVGAAVTTAFSALGTVFTAQLYAAARAREAEPGPA